MRKLYTIVFAAVFFTLAVKAEYSFGVDGNAGVDTTKTSKPKITDTRPNKPSLLQNGVGIKVVPFKPNPSKSLSSSNSNLKNVQPEKVLNNVKVYPNPVADQLNLSYQVSKESNVTIKIMDVLGNEVATLLSQRQTAGEKNPSFDISSRLNAGFYFVRLIVGNETVVKRISVQ